jgi:serine/threonine protein kinase
LFNQVADFGLSKEEKLDGRSSGLKGTFGYVDPEYVSSKTYTKNSDVYSFGILLFELITARNPQQGLMDYINLVISINFPSISLLPKNQSSKI